MEDSKFATSFLHWPSIGHRLEIPLTFLAFTAAKSAHSTLLWAGMQKATGAYNEAECLLLVFLVFLQCVSISFSTADRLLRMKTTTRTLE